MGRCVVRTRVRWVLLAAMVGGMMVLGTGCSDRAILVDQAADQAAQRLVGPMHSDAGVGDRRMAVLPFSGEGPEAMGRKVRHHLAQGGLDVVLLPESEEMRQVTRLIWAMLKARDLYGEGEIPAFNGQGAKYVVVGRFRWFRSKRTLALVGVEGMVVDVEQGTVLWSGEAHGAYVEYKMLVIRVALFVVIVAIVGRVRRLMWASARRANGVLWAVALLVWAMAFYWLLQDYVFYLWKVA